MRRPMSEGYQHQDVRQRIQDLKDISIAIDSWDDIFSDFDPRPMPDRTLSEDFIIELTRRYREGEKGRTVVTIHAPVELRNDHVEHVVINRIRLYLSQRHDQARMVIRRQRLRGLLFVILGFCFLSLLTLIEYKNVVTPLHYKFVEIIMMPLGWFGIWEGFSKIIEIPFKLNNDTQVYKRLSKASYKFEYIGEIKK